MLEGPTYVSNQILYKDLIPNITAVLGFNEFFIMEAWT